MLSYFAHMVLQFFEWWYPMLPEADPSTIPDWQPEEGYFFTYDPSYRLGQRFKALCRGDAASVSFWRKRNRVMHKRRWIPTPQPE